MFKRRLPRLPALLGTAAVAASLIGVAVVGTGAYYTDSHGGQISGNNGSVAITVDGTGTGPEDMDFDFSGILPGAPGKTATITVTNTGSAPEDLYLAFNNDNNMWSAVNDLGQYGKFIINTKTYDNLNNTYTAANSGVSMPGSGVMGGSCAGVPRVAINYLPHVISLGTLAVGEVWSFDINFQYIACMTDHEGEAIFNSAEAGIGAGIAPAPLKFAVAAFQQGVNPNDPFNGTGRIAPLTLPIGGDARSPLGTFQ